MSAEMPSWPDAKEFSQESPYGPTMTCAALADYERSLRLAWEARARLAVEALKWHAGGWPIGMHVYSDNDRCAEHAAKALAVIGPLPEGAG